MSLFYILFLVVVAMVGLGGVLWFLRAVEKEEYN
ncbi:cbb3-type cytochrome oxidase subunit 3 [Paenibacillus polymyxa]|nr:cbb3-type cytochrome oxidase subunit 3 [Paenibacillus polymyxa]